MLPPDSRRSLLVASLGLLLVACYQGDEREKIPPPGYAGGICEGGTCGDGSVCDPKLNYCYFPDDPCYGFYCGGSERGSCMETGGGVPSCTCNHTWVNDLTPMYCCPDITFGNTLVDPLCTPPPPPSGRGERSAVDPPLDP